MLLFKTNKLSECFVFKNAISYNLFCMSRKETSFKIRYYKYIPWFRGRHTRIFVRGHRKAMGSYDARCRSYIALGKIKISFGSYLTQNKCILIVNAFLYLTNQCLKNCRSVSR